MRMFFIFVGMVITIHLAAQTDSSFQSSIIPTYKSVQILTRHDIDRLPVFGFMQLVQAAFPFVGNESVFEEEYSFILNGFVLTNPNAIDISQIESISFIPAGIKITRGSLTKKGSFIINTKPEHNDFSFSTHTGLTLQKRPTNYSSAELKQTENGFSSLSDIRYSHNSQRWFISNSFSFLKSESPHFRLTVPVLPNSLQVINTTSRAKRFRFSNFGGYKFDEHWKAEGSVFLTIKSGGSNIDRTFTSSYYSPSIVETANSETKPRVNYIGGNVGVTTTVKNVVNRLAFEIAHDKDETRSRSDYDNSGGKGFATGRLKNHSTIYALSDHFSWRNEISPSAQLNFSLLARYTQGKSSVKKDSLNQFAYLTGPPSINRSGLTLEDNNKGFLLSPEAGFDYKHILFAEVGVSYDTYTEANFGPNKKKKLLPDAGLRVEFSSLINNPTVSTLEVSANYSKYLTNFSRYDRLGTTNTSNNDLLPYTSPIMIVNANFYGYPPVANWVGSIALGFNNNRFLIKAQYRSQERAAKAYVLSPWYMVGTYSTVMIIEKLKAKGFCFEIKASIIEKEKINWKMYATTFQDKYSRQYKQYPPTMAEPIFMDAGKAPWRGGVRTSFLLNRFYLNASTVINFRELSTDKNGNTKEDMSRYNSNFLIAGYTIPLKNKLKELMINAESSGLFGTPSMALSKYIGIGVLIGL